MAIEDLYAYMPLTEDERLLAEAYISPENYMVGGNVTAKQDTPIGLLTGTVGGNYDVIPKEVNPYAEANLYGNGYNARVALDNYMKSISGGFGNDNANIYGTIEQSQVDPNYTAKTVGGQIGDYSGKVTQDNYGTQIDLNKLFNWMGGQGSVGAYKNPYDQGINLNWMREF